MHHYNVVRKNKVLQETAAYKQHSQDETSKQNLTSSNFEQGVQLPREIPSSKRAEIGEREVHADRHAEAVSRKRKVVKAVQIVRKITARRREELRILRSYQRHRRKKTRNVSRIADKCSLHPFALSIPYFEDG